MIIPAQELTDFLQPENGLLQGAFENSRLVRFHNFNPADRRTKRSYTSTDTTCDPVCLNGFARV
jgi:hypothetical protein